MTELDRVFVKFTFNNFFLCPLIEFFRRFCFHTKGSHAFELTEWTNKIWIILGGGFKYFLCSPLLVEDSHFDEHIFQNGLVQPPTSHALNCFFSAKRYRKLRCLRSSETGWKRCMLGRWWIWWRCRWWIVMNWVCSLPKADFYLMSSHDENMLYMLQYYFGAIPKRHQCVLYCFFVLWSYTIGSGLSWIIWCYPLGN